MLAIEQRYSLAEYRSLEERSEQRHEYANGLVWEMPGGSINHSRIATEICSLLITAVCVTIGFNEEDKNQGAVDARFI